MALALEALGIGPFWLFPLRPREGWRRVFGILQDRLGAELRLKGMVTMEEANRFLQPTFLNAFNRRFAVRPRESQKAWRESSKHLDLDRIISFRYTATVGNDNTARLGGLVLEIPWPSKNLCEAQGGSRQLLNGSWRIYNKDQLIAKHSPTFLKEPLRVFPRNKHHAKGVKDYNWVISLQHPPGKLTLPPCSSNIVDCSATWRFTFRLLPINRDLMRVHLKKLKFELYDSLKGQDQGLGGRFHLAVKGTY